MRIPLVDLTAEHRRLHAELQAAVDGVIESGVFVRGPATASFEEEFAAYCGVGWAVGVGNGTDALRLALLALGIENGDEVVTVPNTFAATAAAVVQSGAVVRFVDVDPSTWMLDASQLGSASADRARAVIPVHLYGHVADVDAIDASFLVVEDAAQAHGARAGGRRVGSLGNAAAFSFYPSKPLGGFGDGGAVVTSDPDVAARVRELGDHGRDAQREHVVPGWNSRLDSLQAAVLSVKLRHLDEMNAARCRLADRYRAQLTDVPEVTFPDLVEGTEAVHYVLVVAVPARDALRAFLAERGIASGVHYPVPLHLQPAFHDLGYARGDFPVAERLAHSTVSLPLYPELAPEHVDEVADALRAFYSVP